MEREIKQYFEKSRKITAVYLFGSHASGREHHMSDVDIGILLDHNYPGSVENLKEKCIVELGRLLRKDIHPVIMNTAGEVLLKQIFSKGRAVLMKNPAIHRDFKMISFSKISDFNFYLSMIQTALKKRILET